MMTGTRPMRDLITRISGLALLLCSATIQGQPDRERTLALIQESAATLAFSPVLVATVREQNARQLDTDRIRERHREWTADPAPTPFKRRLQYNKAATLLRHHVTHHDHLRMAMLTDEQGALAASYPMADGYWLANQHAWRRVFEGHEQAAVAPEPDRTDTAYYRIGAPVYDNGRLIGALLLVTDLPDSAATDRE